MHETDAEYHGQSLYNGGKNLSSHALIDFIKNPILHNCKMRGLVPQKDSDAYKAGRAAHCLILEGKEAYNNRYAFGSPINEKTGKPYGQQTKAYQEWRKSQDREVLTDAEDALCQFMASGVERHTKAKELLMFGDAEVVMRANYCGEPCQIKIDWYTHEAIIDLKTCRDLSRFEYDLRDYKYTNQFSFYQKICEASGNGRMPVYCIAVEKIAPYRTAVYEIEQDALDRAQIENEDAIHRMRLANKTGIYLDGYEEIRTIK